MNKMKKVLLGTALSGVLIAGAGAGTFSWFNAQYQTSGEIENHELTINGATNLVETLTFDKDKLAPGDSTKASFSLENDGSLDQIARGQFDLVLTSKGGAPLDKDMYIITAKATGKISGVTKTYTYNNTADVIDAANNMWLPGDRGLEGVPFKVGDHLTIEFTVKLKEEAGNEYQGANLEGTLKIQTRQTNGQFQASNFQ